MEQEADRPVPEGEPGQRTNVHPADDGRRNDGADSKMQEPSEEVDSLLQELVAYLRDARTELREDGGLREDLFV